MAQILSFVSQRSGRNETILTFVTQSRDERLVLSYHFKPRLMTTYTMTTHGTFAEYKLLQNNVFK